MSLGRVWQVAYYGGLSLVLVLILTRTIGDLLPGSLASEISHNSEGLVILLGVSVWIEFVRRRDLSPAQSLRVTVLAAVAWLLIGLVLRYAPLPPQVATLNEAAFGLAVLVPYLQLSRPLPVWGWLVPLAGVAIPLIGGTNSVTTDLAEAFGAMVLIPLCVDAVDRGILDGSAVPVLRVLAWMAFLVVTVLTLRAIVDPTPSGFVPEVVRYLTRITECFLASLLLHAYFSLLRPELRLAQGTDNPPTAPLAGSSATAE